MVCETPITGQETVLNQVGVKKFGVLRQIAQFHIEIIIKIVVLIETQIGGLETYQGQKIGLIILRGHQEYNKKRTRYRRGHSGRTRLPIGPSARSASWDSTKIPTFPLLCYVDILYVENAQNIYTRPTELSSVRWIERKTTGKYKIWQPPIRYSNLSA